MPGGTAIYRTTFSYFHNSTISQFRNSTITLSLGSLPSGLAHVFVNGSKVDAAAAGGYVRLKRRWALGDVVSVAFDMPCVAHVFDDHVAFTRGPVVLARDARFGDGDISEVVKTDMDFAAPVPCDEIRPVSLDMAMAFSLPLKMGPHTVRTIPGRPARVAFTDYASAGNTWMQDSSYRVWLPLELNAFAK